jgi:protein arginine kinase activator
VSEASGEEIKKDRRVEQLREDLQKAIEEQDFELAAKLRDEIRDIEKEG